MLPPEDDSFPRGGTVVRKRPASEVENLFSTKKSSKPKKAKKSKTKELEQVTEETFQLALNIKGTLTYTKLQTGMVFLGCVRHITNFALEVELPGFCFCSVNITEISDPFTKHLNKQLENDPEETNVTLTDLFAVGEYLLVKIINIEARENKTHVEGTINPREIYAGQNHDKFEKEMLIWGCISSKSDHGYEMSMGIKNCNIFLPFKNIDEENSYVIGKPMWCVVHGIQKNPSSSIFRVSSKSEHINKPIQEPSNLHDVIPGMKVQFVTEKITSHGIQGKYSEHFIGYVHENFLTKPFKKLSDYNEGKILTAYVLFVEPATKITHLSLRPNIRNKEQPELHVGDIIQGEVFCKTSNGMFFLINKQKGFVSNKRLLNTVSKSKSDNFKDAISLKFPVGSRHQCRILDYNHLSNTYICTPESQVVKEAAFTTKDLTPGQLTNVTIVMIKEEGLVVTFGHIKGFIPNLHISNIEYTNNLKKRYKVGQKLDARVLSVDEDKVLFTMKPSLVKSDECLSKMEEAEVGKKYPGVVVKITEKGALVLFYGNIKGWISQKGMGNESDDPQKYFFFGQVVNVFIWKVEGSFIQLSLFKPQIKSALPNVGGRFSGIVASVNEEGINIKIENSTRHGFIPNNHLSLSLNLCNAVKSSLNEGDRVQDLMYVGGVTPQLFSRREAIAMKGIKVPKLEELEVGGFVRCSYQSSSPKGIYVLPLIQNLTNSVLVLKQDVFNGSLMPNFEHHQSLIGKIEDINLKKRQVRLSISLDKIFNGKVESVMSLFTQTICEMSFLRQNGRKQKSDVCKYNIGTEVMCQVERVGAQGGCVVSLPNGVKGIAVPSMCPKSYKEGDTILGTVISHDFTNKFVDVCLKSALLKRINPVQDGNLITPVTSSIAEKLIEKDDCVIAVLKHSQANRQLVYLPTRLHENDFEGCASYYENKKFKVCICGKKNRHLIGLSKKMFLKLDKPSHRVKNAVLNVGKAKEDRKVNKDTVISKSESNIMENEGHEVDLDNEIEDTKSEQFVSQVKITNINSNSTYLPGIGSYFIPLKKETVPEDVSSDEDNEPETKKKKKLSPSEMAQKIKEEEERISKIENELADPNKSPESAEQFDRLLMAHPNSSKLWTQYIAFHIAATEIDKARAVARKALESINMTLSQEKFNIWIVLLNLENMFGTKESFDSVFEEALKFNDSLQIYLKVIHMLAENAKHVEMEEKIKKVKSKHKQEPTMWLEIGKAYYLVNKFKEARNCKDGALKSITDKKTQMNIIVRFAIMEFKHGKEDQGCAIFESILMTDPKKLNIWFTYVDQLIKKDRIDQARQVLERSVSQRLPLKSMKSLFVKFRKFEEDHGTPETVEGVKKRAQDYVDECKE